MSKICAFVGCTRPLWANLLCAPHNAQQWSGRSLRPLRYHPATSGAPNDAEAFFLRASPEPNTGCWLWTGATSRDRAYYRKNQAARFALAFAGRPAPSPSLFALHSCDNGMCVNPSHLRWGTQSENIMDAVRRGRHVNNLPTRRK